MSDSSMNNTTGGDRPTPGVQVREGVAVLMRWASRSDVRRYVFGPAAAELSPTDAALLEHLIRTGPMRLSDLAGQWGVNKSTMTPQVRRLEDKGLIDRQPDPGDRRATVVGISAEGIELQRRIGAAGAAAFDEILSTWPQQDREALGSLLLRFAYQLGHHTQLLQDGSSGVPPQIPKGTSFHD
ncbi:MarR family winged helix-turn-helix transcriptional regulator [Kocuria rosea]|uniref:MarR family winged helix-turn-helix transcriptional regulator n=1 Tax=Kocuria rosea TaxID=1275 RepID=UPI00232C3EBB|nr:MarR family winged helix-turn-helix transcriptional regulator [Kocuria rosea]